MATYTYLGGVPQQYFNDSGSVLASGTVESFVAGTATHAATYSDVNGTQNANPLSLNAAGRPQSGAIFLLVGQSYDFVFKTSGGVTVSNPLNYSAVPGSAATLDTTGVAGEALTAGQSVYLSDGSGGKTAGQWYRADATNTYSSSLATDVGMVPNAIASAASGTIRQGGLVSGLTGLTVGSDYYISGTPGAITVTAPTNRRLLGRADTTASLVLMPGTVSGLVVSQGGTGASTLTNHGVLLGQGTAAIVVTSAGTSGQLLTSNGASADPTFQAAPTQVLTLLRAFSGTDTSAAATNVDTIAISGLSVRDQIEVHISVTEATQQVARFDLYSTTDSVILLPLTQAGTMGAGVTAVGLSILMADQAGTSYTGAANVNYWNGAAAGSFAYALITAPATAWTGSWTLAFRHGGVTAGGTFKWRWAVYKRAGA